MNTNKDVNLRIWNVLRW